MNSELEQAVRARLDSLTKPKGSLGYLEKIALRLALLRGELMPVVARKAVYVFCADHGVTAEGVSPYPSVVTREMMRNFVRGGAAISILCRRGNIEPVIVDVGSAGDPVDGVIERRVGAGTRNFAVEPAMTRKQAEAALEAGRGLAEEAAARFDIAGLGEMGIGNTSAAAAILSVYSGLDPSQTAGIGAGCDSEQMQHKMTVLRNALELHRPDPSDPVGVLSAVGGFEIGAIAGFIVRSAELRFPVVLDGFPCCAGALIARALSASALESVFFAHESTERGHKFMLHLLGARPLLALDMRLGEGTGAALALGVIDAAVGLYTEMATFAEASISGAR
jgi:nicotinate-nucleotide--dimethylbenzimidazole phosphoribosyltransferase